MAIVGALGVIVSTAAGVNALLPKDAKKPEERADLGGLRTHVEPFTSFQAHERLVAAKLPLAPSSGRTVLVASSKPVADATLLAQASTEPRPTDTQPPPTDTQPPPTDTQPPPSDTTQPPSTEISTLPSTIEGTTSIPGTPSGRGRLCVEDTSLSAKTLPLTSTTTSTATNPGSAPCEIVYAIAPRDLRMSALELKRQSADLGKELARVYTLPPASRCNPPSEQCSLTTGMHVMSLAPTQADPATTIEAAKLGLIREELKQLRHTKTTTRADGKRDPLGVRLDYHLRVCGFSNQSVRVFWTLFDSQQPPRIPYYWYSNRVANAIEQKTSACHDVYPSFWVPIPATRGRFTVALTVWAGGFRRGPLIESGPFSS